MLFFTFHALASAPLTQIIDLKKVFTAAPLIYSVLALLSVAAMTIWIYSIVTFRARELAPKVFASQIRLMLQSKNFDQAFSVCQKEGKMLGAIVSAGLSHRMLGPQVMMEAMKAEGKRASAFCWQRLSLLNDIVIIAPMFGLLGTVIGMFYAFYDVNRSIESINALFDGLGVAVGTTVMGLIVAIIAMVFYTTLKYRIVKTLGAVENEALALCPLLSKGE